MISSRCCGFQRLADAARHDPGRVDALAAETLDDLLAELAQRDAVARQVGSGLGNAHDVAPGRVGVEAE